MNTFLSIQQESLICDLTRIELFNRLNNDIHTNINNRGVKEQFTATLLTHYYPNQNVAKRKCKQTYTSGAEFFCKYN